MVQFKLYNSKYDLSFRLYNLNRGKIKNLERTRSMNGVKRNSKNKKQSVIGFYLRILLFTQQNCSLPIEKTKMSMRELTHAIVNLCVT